MRLIALFALAFSFATSACAQPTDAVEADPERAERIILNLRHAFPQLADVPIQLTTIEATDTPGLQRGTLTFGGRQEQPFLITEDDTQLYLLAADPIDASRDVEAIAAAEAEANRERAERLEALTAGYPVRGNPEAPITLVEFSDFQCPYCGRAAGTVEAVLEANPDVRLIYVQYPLPNHPWARPASIAALCAAQQDDAAFWTLHDAYFANQSSLTPANVIDQSRAYLEGAALDMEVWNTCVEDQSSEAHQQAVAELDEGMALAQELGVSGTPAFFVNGRSLNGAQPQSAFEALIEEIRQN